MAAKKKKKTQKQTKLFNIVFRRVGTKMTLTRVFKTKKEATAEAEIVKENKTLEFIEISETKVGK